MQNKIRVSLNLNKTTGRPCQKTAIVKSLIAFSISLMLVFGVQKNINMMIAFVYPNAILGLTSQIIANAASMVSCIILAPTMNNLFGYKKTILTIEILTMICLIAYVFPSWTTIIPGKLSKSESAFMIISNHV